ncbi:MAG TPA: hypothetical protein VN455_11650, partial [Methanotrichaceae archaeon]|nr:hypothetical protein [Methanotrichaceae archaeon]
MISKLTSIVDPIASGLAYLLNFGLILRSVEAGPGRSGAGGALAMPVEGRTENLQALPVSMNNVLANARRRRIIEVLAG